MDQLPLPLMHTRTFDLLSPINLKPNIALNFSTYIHIYIYMCVYVLYIGEMSKVNGFLSFYLCLVLCMFMYICVGVQSII